MIPPRRNSAREKLLAWVRDKGRVTVADLALRSGATMRQAYERLAKLQAAGLLVVEGGGKREPIYWRAT